MFFFCFSFQIETIWLWLSFAMQQFDVYWAVLENILFGSKTTEPSKVCQKVVAFTYSLSLNTFSRIFEKSSSQKSPWNWKDFFVCQGCNSPVKNNGLPLPSPYDLVAAAKMRREYFKDEKSRCMGHQMNTFMYFTRISSPFHSIVLMTFRMHSVQLHCDAFKSLRAWKFKKFIYNVWVCQYHCFTWTYRLRTYSCINVLTLTQIKPMFHFWTTENVWKLYDFLKFSGGKK